MGIVDLDGLWGFLLRRVIGVNLLLRNDQKNN
jgi:hypothetical protein